ncbi:MAG TPA: type II secretion system protein [Patescibacteria group bacterium]|nr:type II secretion system protein [Patescibacteria group bacterium]
MSENKMKFQKAFTLVELLVVISIIGILASIGLVAFRSTQFRSRDAQRKSDLKELSSALELFYSDYGKYPSSGSDGRIQACGYVAGTATGTPCTWGVSEFKDDKGTTYFKVVPKDPVSTNSYFYRSVTVNSVPNSGFQIFAYLENTEDQSKIITSYSCGSGLTCNFAVTSPNTTPVE